MSADVYRLLNISNRGSIHNDSYYPHATAMWPARHVAIRHRGLSTRCSGTANTKTLSPIRRDMRRPMAAPRARRRAHVHRVLNTAKVLVGSYLRLLFPPARHAALIIPACRCVASESPQRKPCRQSDARRVRGRAPRAEHFKSLVDIYFKLPFTRNRDVTSAACCVKPPWPVGPM